MSPPFQAYPGRRRGYRVMQVTNDYILTVDDEVVQIDGSAGLVTITLPDVGLAAGRAYTITCVNGNAVIQDATGNILDSTVGARRYQSDGSNWHEVRGAQRCYIQDDTPVNASTGDLWTTLSLWKGFLMKCKVDYCERPYYGRGYCAMHYQRWRKHGDPLIVKKPVPLRRIREASPTWIGDAIGYQGLHTRLRLLRGRAAEHPCAQANSSCKGPMQWASTTHEYKNEDEFVPLCRSHHARYDFEFNTREVTCTVCGTSFIAKQPAIAKYCSVKCRQIAFRELRRR